MAPLAIAQAIAKHMPAADFIGAIEVAAPGFINFRLSDRWLTGQVLEIERAAGRYGDIDLGQGKRCQVEFISANPTGPLHMGSARNAVLGDTLANVMAAAGYAVQREYYVNDAGTQMRTFAETLYRRYLQVFAQDAPLESHHYQGAYVITLAEEVASEHGDRFLHMPAEEAISALSEIGLQKILVGCPRVCGKAGHPFRPLVLRAQPLRAERHVRARAGRAARGGRHGDKGRRRVAAHQPVRLGPR